MSSSLALCNGTIRPPRHSKRYYGTRQTVRGRKLVSEELQRKGRRRRWLIDYPRGIPVLIFVLVTAITVLSVFAIERGEAQRDAADVARKAQAMTSAIERRAYTSSAYLRAGAALLSTQDEITPELFRRFVSELRLDANYRGAEGIGWAPVVTAAELPEFEARLSRSRVEEQRVSP
ncbi:MAG TPA: hypothetical protein DD369_05775, partial [Erythrobacter sp.]|nr:hypothetical protein [Erythrobacter sp.]